MITFSFNTWNQSAAWGLAPTLPGQITAAANAGFDFVGLDVPSLRSHEQRGLDPKRIRELLDEAAISCYELVPLVIGTDESAESLDDVVRLAPILGARQVLTVVRAPVSPALVSSLRAAVRRLADLGVSTAVEFLPRSPLDSIAATRRLLDAVDDRALTMVVDSWHFFAGPSTWSDLEDLPPHQLGFVQFSDRQRADDDDPVTQYRHHRLLPGEGVDDLPAFARTVATYASEVTVSVEVLSQDWRTRPAADFARACAATTRPFWTTDD